MGQYLNINIPEPCHEDWNKMTPNEQGAFCGSCQKTVVDFSKMGDQQIKDYFLQKCEQKTCGRFNFKQLNKPTSNFFLWKTQLTPLRKFAAALFLVFGTGLFSCVSVTGQTVGEIVVEQDDFNETDVSEIILGKVAAPVIMGDTIVIEESDTSEIIHTVGETEIFVKGDTNVSYNEIIEVITTGLVSLEDPTPEFCGVDSSEVINTDNIDSTEKVPVTFEKPKLIVAVFPNPTKHFFNLEFTIPESGKYKVQVVSMDGKQIKKPTNKQYEIGTYSEIVDVSNFPNGVYFYTISSKKYSHSGKVVVTK